MKTRTLRWKQQEDNAVIKAAKSDGVSANEFIRLACAEKMKRMQEAESLDRIERALYQISAESAALKQGISAQIAGLNGTLIREIAEEFDIHIMKQLDVLAHYASTGRVPHVTSRVSGMDLPPVIQKPTTK